jgi:uncharacterized tellurite resistance protein B-like protein
MNFSDILNLFREGKGTARSHIKNLIEMAVSDGVYDLIEHDLLKKIAKRNNISEADIQVIKENPGKVEFTLPQDKHEKFSQFYDLVHMMTIDSSVHEEEMKLCNIFAVKFGYDRETANEMILSIQNNIRNGQSHEETYKRVEWMIN